MLLWSTSQCHSGPPAPPVGQTQHLGTVVVGTGAAGRPTLTPAAAFGQLGDRVRKATTPRSLDRMAGQELSRSGGDFVER